MREMERTVNRMGLWSEARRRVRESARWMGEMRPPALFTACQHFTTFPHACVGPVPSQRIFYRQVKAWCSLPAPMPVSMHFPRRLLGVAGKISRHPHVPIPTVHLLTPHHTPPTRTQASMWQHSPDGELLASVAPDNRIRVYDAVSGVWEEGGGVWAARGGSRCARVPVLCMSAYVCLLRCLPSSASRLCRLLHPPDLDSRVVSLS